MPHPLTKEEIDKKIAIIQNEVGIGFDDSEITAEAMRKMYDLGIAVGRERVERCTKCNAPFQQHHHRHITREGVYHTSCYNSLPATPQEN